MKYFIFIFGFVVLVSLEPQIAYSQSLQKNNNVSTIIENSGLNNVQKYINEINEYVNRINSETKDNDTLVVLNQLNMLKSTHRFTKSTSEKKVAYNNNEIVKEKYTDFLENNFIKIKSLYFQNNLLVCVRFYEIRPIQNKPLLITTRSIYYEKGDIIFDTKQQSSFKKIANSSNSKFSTGRNISLN